MRNEFFGTHGHDPITANFATMIDHGAADLCCTFLGLHLNISSNASQALQLIGIGRNAFEAIWKFFGDESRGDIPTAKTLMPHHSRKEGQVVANAFHLKIIQRLLHGVDRREAIRRPGAEFGDHRIIEH